MALRHAFVATLILIAAWSPARGGDTTFTYDPAGNLLSVSDVDTDPLSCGAPGNVCADAPHGTPRCDSGGCVLDCDEGFEFHSSFYECLDPLSDPRSCGGVGNACDVPDHGSAVCTEGVCGIRCDVGFTPAGNLCVSLAYDPAHCGTVGRSCPQVVGYYNCCRDGVCGATEGAACVNVSADPMNCGWVGHVCQGQGAACTNGRCSKPAGTPSVTSVNGKAPTDQAFRSPFWGGITVAGANLDRVTWIELEDWGSDTVDGTPDGVRSVPRARVRTLPTQQGPTIHYGQSSSTLTVDASSLQFEWSYDPWFDVRRWYKIKLHYNGSGGDRSIIPNVAVSFADRVPVGLPAPSISTVAAYYAWVVTKYDPATGLLYTEQDATTQIPTPSAVLAPDLAREFPVLAVAPEGLYLPRGLRFSGVALQQEIPEGYAWVSNVVVPYAPSGTRPLVLHEAGLIIRGSHLWEDGDLRFAYPLGNGLPGDFGNGDRAPIFQGDKIIVSGVSGATAQTAFLEFASIRGTATTPWPVRWIDRPRLSSIEDSAGAAEFIKIGELLTIRGSWLEVVDEMYLLGPSDTHVYHDIFESLVRVEGEPGLNQYQVVNRETIRLVIGERVVGGDESVVRGKIRVYACDGSIIWYEGHSLGIRWLGFGNQQSDLWDSALLYAGYAQGADFTYPRDGEGVWRDGEYVCSGGSEGDEDPQWDPTPTPVGLDEGGGGCTNTICPPPGLP